LPALDLVNDLINREERPWGEWRHGRPLTAQSIAKLLRPFDVKQRPTRAGTQVFRAYHREDVEAAFERYAAQPPKKPLQRYGTENMRERPDFTSYTGDACTAANPVYHEQKQRCNAVDGISGLWAGHAAKNDPHDERAWK
jgi:hypothetical protein